MSLKLYYKFIVFVVFAFYVTPGQSTHDNICYKTATTNYYCDDDEYCCEDNAKCCQNSSESGNTQLTTAEVLLIVKLAVVLVVLIIVCIVSSCFCRKKTLAEGQVFASPGMPPPPNYVVYLPPRVDGVQPQWQYLPTPAANPV